MLPRRADSRLTDSAAPKLLQIQTQAEGRSTDVQDQAAPSRSAVVSVRASFGRSRQSQALGLGKDDDDWRSPVSLGAAAGEDSYRFAALNHESRNLRKSSRVSLSVASCARAAHSAAFCRQYPIFCHMTVSPFGARLPRQEPGERTRRMLPHLKSGGGR